MNSQSDNNRRKIIAWCWYDWANSGYTTLLITIFVIYIQRIVFADQDRLGAVVWAWSIAISMMVGAILSPFAGAIADKLAAKRIGLGISAVGGGVCCVLIGMFPDIDAWQIVTLLILANLGLELSLTFYNGFLPEIAEESKLDDVSAKGFAVGYFGGGLALLAAMILLSYGDSLPMAKRLRICIVGTGIWWIVFTIPALLFLKDGKKRTESSDLWNTLRDSGRNTLATFAEFKSRPTLFLFLIAFLIYNDGIQTVISQSSTFALQELEFTESSLVGVVLMIQFLATPGALLIGKFAEFAGRRLALICCLATWILLLIAAWLVTEANHFWWLAAGVALVLGGTQSVSRSIMGSLTPAGHEARYFGFFNFSGKATSFLGTFFFGAVVAATGSSRMAIIGLALFFVIGLLIICRLKSYQLTAEPGQV